MQTQTTDAPVYGPPGRPSRQKASGGYPTPALLLLALLGAGCTLGLALVLGTVTSSTITTTTQPSPETIQPEGSAVVTPQATRPVPVGPATVVRP